MIPYLSPMVIFCFATAHQLRTFTVRQNYSIPLIRSRNYKLEYLSLFPSEYQEIDIPHNVKDLPYNYFDEKCYQKVVTYLKEFDDDNIIEANSKAFITGQDSFKELWMEAKRKRRQKKINEWKEKNKD